MFSAYKVPLCPTSIASALANGQTAAGKRTAPKRYKSNIFFLSGGEPNDRFPRLRLAQAMSVMTVCRPWVHECFKGATRQKTPPYALSPDV